MKPSTSIDINALTQLNDYPCISIYLPTHIKGSEVRQDPIRFKNLLNDCKTSLKSEFSQKDVNELLMPGYDLLNDSYFWIHQNRGLVLFISPSFSQFYYLSLAPDEKVYIGKYFNIMPLIPETLKKQDYYILLLSQNEIKLLKSNGDNLNEIELYDTPKNIDDILKYDVTEEQLQVHTIPFGKSEGTSALFHGQGNIADDSRHKKNVERYIKIVAKKVDKQLQGQTAPLVLAGIEYEQAIYRQCSTYKNLMKKGVLGDVVHIDVQQLNRQAQIIAEPYLNKDIEESLAMYQNLINTKMTNDDINEILPAAYVGRIDTIFVEIGKHIFGTFEPKSQKVNIIENNENNEEDLLNLATIYSLRNNSKVCPFTSGQIGKPIAAIFRY